LFFLYIYIYIYIIWQMFTLKFTVPIQIYNGAWGSVVVKALRC